VSSPSALLAPEFVDCVPGLAGLPFYGRLRVMLDPISPIIGVVCSLMGVTDADSRELTIDNCQLQIVN
jgi:hypothetical protein